MEKVGVKWITQKLVVLLQNAEMKRSLHKFKLMSMVSIILSAAGVFIQFFIKKETNDLLC